ncbi:MAG: phosphatase PAP2 family protein [Albidovulum sp.]
MKNFFRFVILYLILAMLVTGLTRSISGDVLTQAMVATVEFSATFGIAVFWLLPVFLGAMLIVGWRKFLSNAYLIGYAAIGSVLLQVGFSLLKANIPMIVPFYADVALATFDTYLHGGVDPWVLTHDWAQHLPIKLLLPLYLSVWVVPALALVLIIAVSDRCAERTARFVVLYIACWLVLGNILALVGSSAGPVYYDAIYGGQRFAALIAALDSSGLNGTMVGTVQRHLWDNYQAQSLSLGASISAFPSVHVGIATLTALYMTERNRWLALPGLAFVGAILFLSVYTGYHYAVDGYFSILFVGGLWAVLRRMQLSTWSMPKLRIGRRGAASAKGAA